MCFKSRLCCSIALEGSSFKRNSQPQGRQDRRQGTPCRSEMWRYKERGNSGQRVRDWTVAGRWECGNRCSEQLWENPATHCSFMWKLARCKTTDQCWSRYSHPGQARTFSWSESHEARNGYPKWPKDIRGRRSHSKPHYGSKREHTHTLPRVVSATSNMPSYCERGCRNLWTPPRECSTTSRPYQWWWWNFTMWWIQWLQMVYWCAKGSSVWCSESARISVHWKNEQTMLCYSRSPKGHSNPWCWHHCITLEFWSCFESCRKCLWSCWQGHGGRRKERFLCNTSTWASCWSKRYCDLS